MEVDDASAEASGSRINRDAHDNLVDDDDLQEALAKARREAAKKASKRKPEDIAAESTSDFSKLAYTDDAVAQRRDEEDAQEEVKQEPGDERITFDDTSAFIRNVSLQSLAVPVKRERVVSELEGASVQVKAEPDAEPEAGPSTVRIVVPRVEAEEGEDVDMDGEDEDEELAEMAAREGMSLEEMRIKIDKQMEELAAGVKQDVSDADGVGVCPRFITIEADIT
jgi:U4/U6.U5 tri-snRNP-associated protein 1